MAKAPVLPAGFELPLEPRLARIGSVDQVAVDERAKALEAKRKAARLVTDQRSRAQPALYQFVPGLVERCRELHPRRIVLIKATVFDAAYPALKNAGLPVSSVRVPFPGSGRQRQFLEAFERAVSEPS
jgi:hypothetical protein